MIGSFLNYLSLEKAYSPHTVTSYENDLRAFQAYLGKAESGLELKDADADLVRGWAMKLMSSGMKATSVNRKLSSLRAFYKYLLKKGVVSVSPVQNVGDTVEGKVDWPLRFSRMQNHCAEHILSGVIHKMFGYNNVGFHMSEIEMTVDFDIADDDVIQHFYPP